MSPRISVLMPAYNAEKYIAESIESILNQTFPDFEFIIINDGSTDNTAKIIRQYARRDKRIKFIDNRKNQGLIAVLNQGLDLCSGEYIARMDSDDISLPTRFEKQVAYMDANSDVGILGTSIMQFTNNGDENPSQKKSCVSYMDVAFNCPVCHPSAMMRRAVLEKYGLRYRPEYLHAEDYDLWAQAVLVTKIHNLPDILLRYRWHNSNISVTEKAPQAQTAERIRRELLELLSDAPELQNKLRKIANDTRYFNPAWLSSHMKSHHPIRFRRLATIAINMPRIPEYCFGMIKFHNKSGIYDIRVCGLSIWKIKRLPHATKYFLFGINIHTKRIHPNCPESPVLSALKIDNKQILSELKKQGRFTYIPNTGNAGDMLIASATYAFFKEHNIRYKRFTNKKHIRKTIVYGGGGIWTSDYEKYWTPMLRIFARAKRIVILPSSFNDCQKLLEMLDERFVVFCREKRSYEYLMSAKTRAKILLDHDMAFRMRNVPHDIKLSNNAATETFKARPWANISKTARFIRQDVESAGEYQTDMDVSALVHGDYKQTTSEYADLCACMMLHIVNQADNVITDRLHVAIAAMLLNKQVYMLDNSYGKLSAVYEHSMKNNKNIHFCKKMPSIYDD